MSDLATAFTKYVNRSDYEEFFEGNVVNILESENLILLGSPGVGKSASSKAIAARYSKPNHPAIILSISRGRERFDSWVELVQIDGKPIPVTTLSVPFTATDSDLLLKNIIQSLTKLQRLLSTLSGMMENWHESLENLSLINNIKDHLSSILHEMPEGTENLLEFAKILTEVTPYVTATLRLIDYVMKHQQKNKLKQLEEKRMLIVIDDLEDLRPNWIVLTHLLSYKFRYLFVARVEEPDKYVSMLNDRMFVTKYLENIGIPLRVKNRLILPPPSFEVFRSIMRANFVNENSILSLWKYTGGFPATALMIYASSPNQSLDNLFEKVTASLERSPLSEKTWKHEDWQDRLAYSYYAIKVVYEQLKSKNYGFVALSAQPMGVSADELLLFCGCIFHQIYSCSNKKAKEVYEKIFDSGSYCSKNSEISFLDGPCIGNERCSYLLEKPAIGVTESYPEHWKIKIVEQGKIIDKELPTVMGQNAVHLVYQFNKLFRHIPRLLVELEKNDIELHDELNETRAILLKIMDREAGYVGGTNLRMVLSAYDHIIKLVDNLDNIDRSAINFMVFICLRHPELGYEARKILPKMLKMLKHNDEIDNAKLLLALSQLSSTIKHEKPQFATYLAQQTFIRFENIKSETRSVLLLHAYALANIASVTLYDKNMLNKKSIALVQKILEKEDELSLYAKTLVYPTWSVFYFDTQKLDEFRVLIEQANHSLNLLIESHRRGKSGFGWMSDLSYVNPEIEIIGRRADINAKMAMLFYYLDQLTEAADKYNKAKADYENLSLHERVFINSCDEYISKLFHASDDVNFECNLNQIATVDTTILNWIKEKDENVFLILPSLRSHIHSNSVLARAALNIIYKKEIKSDVVEALLEKSSIFYLYSEIYALQAIAGEQGNVRKFIGSTILYLRKFRSLDSILEPVFKLYYILEDNKSNDTERTGEKDYNYDDLKDSILNEVNKLEEDDEFRTFCELYRNGTDEGLLVEAVSSMVLLAYREQQRRECINLMVGMLLIHGNYEECSLFLLLVAQSSKMPLERRLFREMAHKVISYNKSRSIEDRKQVAKEYLMILYY